MRSFRLAATLALVSSLLVSLACAHAPESKANAAPEGLEPTVETRGELVIRTYDLNRDGKADDWKTFKVMPGAEGQTHEVMIERELDTNFDGKVDLTTFYDDDGTRTKEIYDLDFDGKPDVIDLYEHGVLVRKEMYQTHREKPDATGYYEGGKKVRVERDTKGNGKIDTWEYYEAGKLSRIGEDIDGDGLVDHWIKAKSEDGDDSPAPKVADKPADKPDEKAGDKPADKAGKK